MKIIERIYDAQTGLTNDIEREETLQEKNERETLEAQIAKELSENAAKAQARQALLDKLGITEDEAKLLLGGN